MFGLNFVSFISIGGFGIEYFICGYDAFFNKAKHHTYILIVSISK
jgi:hypothetical protein